VAKLKASSTYCTHQQPKSMMDDEDYYRNLVGATVTIV
jgi:hypothetical protein